MRHYNFCPNCGNRGMKKVTADVTLIFCKNKSCRFCHVVEPPNSMGDKPNEFTTILDMDRWNKYIKY